MKAKILIVEDEMIEAMSFEQSLKSFGYDVVGIASTGEEAVEKAGKFKPDLILMDIVLKGEMDGIEAATLIKEDFDIPVVFLTAHPEESVVYRAKLISPYGYLIKPVNKIDLKITIELALHKHQREGVLKVNESLYRMLFENSQVSTAITSMDGQVITANDKFFEMIGYKPEEKNEIDLRSMYQDINQRNHILETLKKGDRIKEYEVKLKHKDGTLYTNSINVDLIRYHDEDAMLVTAIDITKRKQVEKHLQEINRRYNDLVNNMSSGVAVYTAIENGDNFIFVDINQAIENLESIKKEEVIGRKVTDVFPGMEEFGLLEVFQRVYHTWQPEHHPLSQYKDNRITGWKDNFVYKLPTGEIVAIYEDITKSKQAEEALKESERRFKDIIETNTDFIWEMDTEGRYTYCSPQIETLWGIKPEDMIGKTPFEMMPVSERENAIKKFRQMANSPTGINGMETTSYDSKGNLKYIEISSIPIFDANKKLLGYRGISRDVTERKLVEKELERRETYYRAIFEHTGTATLILDEDNTISMANRECEKLSGYSVDEIVGKYKWTDFVVKEDLEKMEYYHQKRLENHNSIPKTYNFRLVNKNGQIRNIKLDIDLIPGTKKSVASLRDITDRIKATEMLNKERNKLKSILDSMIDGVYIVNKDYEIEYVNPSIENEFGLVEGQKCYQYLHDQDDVCQWCKNKEVFSGKTVKWEWTQKKTGKTYELFDIPLKNPDDSISKLEIFHDITHRKLTEDALIESEKKYRDLVDYSMVAVYRTNLEGEILFANDAMARMFDFESVDDLKATNIIQLYRNIEDRKRLLSPIKKDKFVTQFEVEAVSKTGRIFNALLSAHLSDDKISGMIMDITELRKAEKVIKKSLEEKENLLKEIHHRVKNNLQIISSLLNLQEDYVSENTIAVNVLKESQNRVLSMAMIHEMIYESENLSNINFSDYIKNLTTNLFHSYGAGPHIELLLDVKQVFLNIETAIPLGLLITELISNSLKYAFPSAEKGNITVKLEPKKENYELIISDNGIGIPPNIDFNNQSTLGLRLVHSLVNQLDGTIELDRTHGTQYTINFQELKYKKRF